MAIDQMFGGGNGRLITGTDNRLEPLNMAVMAEDVDSVFGHEFHPARLAEAPTCDKRLLSLCRLSVHFVT